MTWRVLPSRVTDCKFEASDTSVPWAETIRPGPFFMPWGVRLRITRWDGLIDRAPAAERAGVTPDAGTVWATRGYMVTETGDGEKRRVRRFLPVAKREGRKPLYSPVEVQKAEIATRRRGRREVRRAFPAAA